MLKNQNSVDNTHSLAPTYVTLSNYLEIETTDATTDVPASDSFANVFNLNYTKQVFRQGATVYRGKGAMARPFSQT